MLLHRFRDSAGRLLCHDQRHATCTREESQPLIGWHAKTHYDATVARLLAFIMENVDIGPAANGLAVRRMRFFVRL